MSIVISNKDRSWLEVEENSDFPIQNLPFGVFKTKTLSPRVGVAIGTYILDLSVLHEWDYFDHPFGDGDFLTDNLNALMHHGKKACSELRNTVYQLLRSDCTILKDETECVKKALILQSDSEMLMPVKIGDYTDFYSSRDHATNVGIMFRDPANALLPNWLHLPVAYHGRASSIICSGQPVHRPKGQMRPDDDKPPIFGPTKQLDFELEMAFVTFEGKPLGQSIAIGEADDYIFGMCLFNDWSARDIQKWEYVPLGPFLAKNFASSMSPWIVTMDALEQFRVSGPNQQPEPLPYLKYSGDKNIDINLEVIIQPETANENTVSRSNYKHMYWNMSQQLAHHTVNGCNIRCGDMVASGTISGPDATSCGSMLELAWKGTKPIKLNDGTERKFIQDGDTVIMRGHCKKDNTRIGFGEVKTKILPAI